MSNFYFWDTYAFFEIINGNTNYLKYSNFKGITTIFNLVELNYNLKKEMPKKLADKITKKYSEMLIDVTFEDIIEAGDLKKKNRLLSLPDCIGYVIAKRTGAKFLTGDKQFEKTANVEFVK